MRDATQVILGARGLRRSRLSNFAAAAQKLNRLVNKPPDRHTVAPTEVTPGRRDLLDREQLETFATVAEHGSFDRAAMALNVTRGAISQRIKALEESLAAVLLVREKPVRPTPRGEMLLRHVKALRVLEAAMLQEVLPIGSECAPVPVAIAVNADSLVGWFGPIVSRLTSQHRVALEIVSDDQDHTFTRLARGEVIGCVSTESNATQGFLAEPLGAMEYRCVAERTFAAQHFPNGLTLPAVLSAPAVLFDRKDALHDSFLCARFGFKIERYVRHYIPSPHGLLDAIAAGCGYGVAPTDQAQPLLDEGRLVELAPNIPTSVSLYWHHWESELPLAREITRIVLDQARQALAPPTAQAPAPPAA